MRIFAGGATGGGIGILYLAIFAAGPKFYNLIPTEATFAAMCAVTAVAIAASLRSGMLATGILAQIGGYLTPVVLSTGRDEQVVLMIYLLAMAVAFLAVAWAKRWPALTLVSLAGTLMLFGGWYAQFYRHEVFVRTCAFGWTFAAVFLLFAVATFSAATAGRTGQCHRLTGQHSRPAGDVAGDADGLP